MAFKTMEQFNEIKYADKFILQNDGDFADGGKKGGTGKELLSTFNLPVTNQILKCRSLVTLIGTFVEKLPNNVSKDNRIHCQFKQMGADTGRMSSAEPKKYSYWVRKIRLTQGRAIA